jgi:hypothetical protein
VARKRLIIWSSSMPWKDDSPHLKSSLPRALVQNGEFRKLSVGHYGLTSIFLKQGGDNFML